MWINENKINVSPSPKSLYPELMFDLELNIRRTIEVPLEIRGFLYSAKEKKIANLQGILLDQNKTLNIAAQDSRDEREQRIFIRLFAPLDYKIIDYLHSLRDTNTKGDVILNLEVRIKVLTSNTALSHLFLMDGEDLPDVFSQKYRNEGEEAQLVYHRYQDQFSSKYTNMWILSGEGGSTFLKFYEGVFTLKKLIPSADWIHDFCPIFEVGTFSVVELAMPDYIEGSESLNERLNKAIDSLKKMKENLIKNEYNKVIEASRPVSELLRNQEEVKDLLMRDGYTPEAYHNLNKCFQQLFSFASKFHHVLDAKKKKIMPDMKACREDAYLIYNVSTSLVNLLSKKNHRLS